MINTINNNIMKYILNIINKTFIIFTISLFYILFFEIFLRISFAFFDKNKNYLLFFFNKNYIFEIVDLSEFKFNLDDLRNQNVSNNNVELSTNNFKQTKPTIWAFGASLTYGLACGTNSSSWPSELDKINKDFNIVNFGFPSIYSEDSIKKLIYELNNKKIKKPEYILWAHRDEEKLAIIRGLKRNREKINDQFSISKGNNNYYLMRIEKTLEKNSISYLIFKHIVTKMQKRFNIYNIKETKPKKFTEKDYKLALKNFEINTLDAIDRSLSIGSKGFIIVSLFTDNEFVEKRKPTFSENYLNTIKKIQDNKSNFVSFIDTFEHLNTIEKKEFKDFYCDNKHYTLIGNQKIAEIINRILFNYVSSKS